MKLYSFRRCPYAMRARMALRYCRIPVDIHEVSLKAKPEEMLVLSPKGTVPVLVLRDGTVIDESLDIMRYALAKNDPDDWLMQGSDAHVSLAESLIAENDNAFKAALDRYKYAIRFPEKSREEYRAEGEVFLQKLENLLGNTRYLCHDTCSYADIAIFPFIRQFALADEAWFAQSPYPALRSWLGRLIESQLFVEVMQKAK